MGCSVNRPWRWVDLIRIRIRFEFGVRVRIRVRDNARVRVAEKVKMEKIIKKMGQDGKQQATKKVRYFLHQ